MHVLYVTSGFPYPLTSGYLRHYHLIGSLREAGHEITLASLVGPMTTGADIDAMRPRVERLVTHARVGGLRGTAARGLELGGARPADDVRALVRSVAKLRSGGVDAAVISGKRTAPVLRVLDGTPVVADLCDATSERLAGMAAAATGLARQRILLELGHVRRAERDLVRQARHLLVASERDRDAMVANGVATPERISVLPNGVDAEYWRRTSAMLGADRVVFTGVMSYEPNADAALALVEGIMPLVREAVPGARLDIVGRDPLPALVDAARRARATVVTGYVDDVRPYLEAASVFAAPLRFGAGIQNKLLEAMAMAVPSVASTLAAEGLAIDGGRPPVAVADDPAAFADAIAATLSRVRADRAPDDASRAYVVERFSWQRSGERLDEIVRAVGARS